MKKLLPYFALLNTLKIHFFGALACGLVYAGMSGFGLAYVLREILPKLYGELEVTNWVLFLIVGQLPLAFAIRSLAGFANAYLIAYCGVRILEKMRLQMFRKLQELHLSFFERHSAGDLLSRTMNDTQILQETIIRVSNDLIIQPITLLASISFLIWMAFVTKGIGIVLLFLLMVPVCVFPIRFIARKLHLRARDMQRELGAVTEFVRENLSAAKDVRAFDLGSQQQTAFATLVRKYLDLQIVVVKHLKAITPSIEFITSVGIALAIFYARRVGVTLNDVIPVVIALYFAYDPVKKLGVVSGELKRGLASLERMEEIIQEPVVIQDRPDAIPLNSCKGEFGLVDVNFRYGNAPVLKDLNCALEAGKAYALVGPSGAGKSTFINLLLRLYEINSGAIKLDGHDLRGIQLSGLRRQIALVAQDPVLFDDTIYNNILLSRPEATEQEIFDASHNAYADGFIENMEDGYHTVVGDRGTRLSGGQIQRIALARAFLKDAPILILDEATSALDSESESFVQRALQKLLLGKTVFIIAHRFSTIQLVDEILVFDAGRMIDKGTHRDLYDRCPLYRNVYDKQKGF